MPDEGALIKLGHQLARARKLADVAMFQVGTTHAELLAQAHTDHWVSMALVAGITPPSEETIVLTIFLIEDRELYADRLAKDRGSKGGNKTKERGPSYYKDLQAKRTTKAGGRPKKGAA